MSSNSNSLCSRLLPPPVKLTPEEERALGDLFSNRAGTAALVRWLESQSNVLRCQGDHTHPNWPVLQSKRDGNLEFIEKIARLIDKHTNQ